LSCVGDHIPRRRGGPRQIKTHTITFLQGDCLKII
jgi:hypothetical protein